MPKLSWIFCRVFLISDAFLFSIGSNSNIYLNFLQSFLKLCNSSTLVESVITIGKLVSIFEIKFATILLYLFSSSFWVTLISSRSLLAAVLFRARAYVLCIFQFCHSCFFQRVNNLISTVIWGVFL